MLLESSFWQEILIRNNAILRSKHPNQLSAMYYFILVNASNINSSSMINSGKETRLTVINKAVKMAARDNVIFSSNI